MLQAFRDHLRRTNLIPEGARVLVGYSGGADSTCLLHLLKECGVDTVAAHLHHGQREEADTELKLCEAFCQELDVPFVSGRANVPQLATDMKIGLEEAGRNARYAFFTQAAFRLDCDLVATAHTRSDQVETVLLNLVRGTGLAGLSGIPERRANIVRPLLPFSRTETRTYCEERGLWFHNDPSNEDLSFARARTRLRIVPEMRAINPSADENVVRLAAIAAEENSFLNGMAAAALEQSEILLNGKLRFLTEDVEAAFDRDKLTGLPPVLFKRSLRLAAEALGAGFSQDQTEVALNGIATTPKGAVTAEGGEVVIEWSEGEIVARSLRPTTPFRYPLTLPGETESEEFGWVFTCFEAEPSGKPTERATLETEIDAAKASGQLYFRTFKDGDRMQPLGFDGHRKLADLLSEAGLTQAARARLPIVCDLVGPVWAPGVCLDERVRVQTETSRTIILRFATLQRT